MSWCFIAIVPTVIEFLLMYLAILFGESKLNDHKKSGLVSVRATNVSFSFNRLKVLDKLNLHHRPNEMMCLLGNNGCGKTTFVRCVLNDLLHKGKIEKSDHIMMIP